MNNFSVKCPSCGIVLAAESKYLGYCIRCGNCAAMVSLWFEEENIPAYGTEIDSFKPGIIVRAGIGLAFQSPIFSQEQLQLLTSKEDCRRIFHCGQPLLRAQEKGCFIEGSRLYWQTSIICLNHNFLLYCIWTKANIKYFIQWLRQLKINYKDLLAACQCYSCENIVKNTHNILPQSKKEDSISLAEQQNLPKQDDSPNTFYGVAESSEDSFEKRLDHSTFTTGFYIPVSKQKAFLQNLSILPSPGIVHPVKVMVKNYFFDVNIKFYHSKALQTQLAVFFSYSSNSAFAKMLQTTFAEVYQLIKKNTFNRHKICDVLFISCGDSTDCFVIDFNAEIVISENSTPTNSDLDKFISPINLTQDPSLPNKNGNNITNPLIVHCLGDEAKNILSEDEPRFVKLVNGDILPSQIVIPRKYSSLFFDNLSYIPALGEGQPIYILVDGDRYPIRLNHTSISLQLQWGRSRKDIVKHLISAINRVRIPFSPSKQNKINHQLTFACGKSPDEFILIIDATCIEIPMPDIKPQDNLSAENIAISSPELQNLNNDIDVCNSAEEQLATKDNNSSEAVLQDTETSDYTEVDEFEAEKLQTMSWSYQEWNQLLLERFFYKSVEGSVIRLDVSPGWFDSLNVEFDARNDLINAVCGRPEKFSKMFRAAIKESSNETPSYLPLLAFFCIPWGEIDDDDNGYDEYIKDNLTNNENYKEKIRIFFEGNRRFRDFIPELFYKLKDWADANINVKGTFCFARLHGSLNNKNSFFRSQVLLRPKDETKLQFLFNKLPFRKHYNQEELLKHLLESPSYKLPTAILNLLNEKDADEKAQNMRVLLQREATKDIYSEWEDWVEEGRPEVSLVSRNNTKNHSNKRSQLFLALSAQNGKLKKHLIVKTNDIEDLNKDKLTVNGVEFEFSIGPEFSNIVVSDYCILEKVWNELAALTAAVNIGDDFYFYPEKYYVMTNRRPYLIQDESNRIPPQGDYFLLHMVDSMVTSEIAKEFPNAKTFDCGNGWRVTRCDRIITLDGEAEKTSMQKQIKLSGGERTKYRLGLREYLIDFLPSIEAYLPQNGYYYEVLEPSKVGAIKLEEVKSLIDEDSANDISLYSWRRFDIICNDDEVSYCKIRFVIDNNNENLDLKTLDFHISNDEQPISAQNKMDCFGELEKGNDKQEYWPMCDWQKMNMFYDEAWNENDADLDEFPWRFLKTLRDATGTRGISNRTLYWTFIYNHSRNTSPWRYPKDYNYDLLLLSYLAVLDIYTDKHGLWSKFFALPPAIYPLPDGVNFIFTGCYNKEMLIKLRDTVRATNSCKISIKKHNPGSNVDVRLLPPLVKLTGDYDKLRQISENLAIDWVETPPAIGYSILSASVNDWFNMIWGGPLESNSVKNGVQNWYSPTTYTVQETSNPFTDSSNSILHPQVCFYTKPAPFIKNSRVKYFQMTKAGSEDYFAYIYDRSWARWQCHSDIRVIGEEERRVFNIPYDKSSGTLWLPEVLKLPKILARAAVACTGKIPDIVDNFDLYAKRPFGHNFCAYSKKCARFQGVPEAIAQMIAEKINAQLVKIDTTKEYEPLPKYMYFHPEAKKSTEKPEDNLSPNIQDTNQHQESTLAYDIVDLIHKNYCSAQLVQELAEVYPINKLRKTQIFYTAAEDEEEDYAVKYGMQLALCVMKYVQLSWQKFYINNASATEEDIAKKHEMLEIDVKYFMLNNYNIFFQKGNVLDNLHKNQNSWEGSLISLCKIIGEIFANFTGLARIKKDLLHKFNNDTDQKRSYEKIYKLIEEIIFSWDNYLYDSHDISNDEEFDNVADKILNGLTKDIYEDQSLLSVLHRGDCCSPLFYHLLRDRTIGYNKQNDSILENAQDILENYVKKHKENCER